jgi:DisA bacterial checkpoint controller nucleotide-binding
MNDLLYYEPLADLFEADVTYRSASTQVRFGYLTLAASFHWNLLKLLGDISPTYHLAPPAADDNSTLVQLPYLNGSLTLHVKADGVSSDDWLERASAALLAEVHSDCMASLLCVESADVATTLLSNVGHTVVIRVVLNALRLAHRRTVDPAVLEEAISTLCLLSHRRYEGRIPELAVCFGQSRRRPDRYGPAVYFGREFLASKKSAVLLKGGTLLLHCLGNGRVVEVVDLNFASSGPVSERVLAPLGQLSILNYSYGHGAVTAILTRQGEVLVAMGARICFAWDAASWRVYPATRLANQLSAELTRICTGKGKALAKHLARHITTIALTLREDRLGALLVVSSSEEMIGRLLRNKQASVSPVEALYSRLFVGRPLCKLSPQLVCNAAALDGAVVIDGNGIVRGIGCIFETQGVRTAAEGARTRAALFASKDGVALKISQDGEMSIFSNSKNQATIFSPVW